MAVIRQLKGLWGVAGTLRQITDVFQRPLKVLMEQVTIGLPSWDPPPPAPPLPPDQEAVDRAMEVIGMGSVEEQKAFSRVMGTWRKITTGAPREPARIDEPPALPRPRPPAEEAEGES